MPTKQLKKHLTANFAGKFWAIAMSLAFIPVYIRTLGIEAYGVIGVYISLLALLSVLDIGLSTTLNRELARLSASGGTDQEARDLARTLEIIYWGIGITLGLAVALLAPAIAHRWVKTQSIPPDVVEHAIRIMGMAIAFEWPAALYTGGLMGLQRQVLLNAIRAMMATIQFGGAAVLLLYLSAGISDYFAWQFFTSFLQTALLAGCLWKSLPKTGKPAAFRFDVLAKNIRFAAGMTGISIAVTVLTQLDKLILSKFLDLGTFGYYMLASNVANGLHFLVNPFISVYFPALSRSFAEKDTAGIVSIYHNGCRLLSAVVIPVSATLIFYSREILMFWMKDPATTRNSFGLLSTIAIGTTLNAIMTFPYILQLASGWTRLSFYKNVAAVIVLVPALILMIGRYGAMGAAIIWVILNACYFFLEIPLMHKYLLKDEMWRWYIKDVGVYVSAVFLFTGISRLIMPANLPAYYGLPWVIATLGIASLLSTGIFQSGRQRTANGSR
jgi:O-antigen/teichoic acid export membrane protein